MERPTLSVPVALLLDKELHPSTKLLWMAKRLGTTSAAAELQRRSGLARSTVLDRVASIPNRPYGGPHVKFPTALLAARTVSVQAKLLYGLLQLTKGYRYQSGQFTVASLAEQTRLSRNTMRQAIRELRDAGWIQTTQANRLMPVAFTLTTPARTRSQAEISIVARRIKRADHEGEAIALEWLTLLIDSEEFTDHARPGFLVSPLTDERLELDRFYPPNVGFEFHGAQHDRESENFPLAKVKEQQTRDYIKAGLCLYRGIHLVIIRPEDLSLAGMLKRIGTCLPLRDLTGKEGLIEYLEDESMRYQMKAEAARQAGR